MTRRCYAKREFYFISLRFYFIHFIPDPEQSQPGRMDPFPLDCKYSLSFHASQMLLEISHFLTIAVNCREGKSWRQEITRQSFPSTPSRTLHFISRSGHTISLRWLINYSNKIIAIIQFTLAIYRKGPLLPALLVISKSNTSMSH